MLTRRGPIPVLFTTGKLIMPSNSDNVIDSRDVIARIDELEGDEDRDDDDNEELAALKALADKADGYASDWKDGATLIRDDYFETYAEELARDCGMIPNNLAWPCTCIDWEQAADELKQDYTSVDFDGVDYWVR